MTGGDEHTGVFSGAVAVDGGPGDAGELQGILGRDVHRIFRPAVQVAGGESRLPENTLHSLDVKGLSVVGGTDDSQLPLGDAVVLQRAALRHGDGLDGLGGGTGKGEALRVTQLPEKPARVVCYRNVAPVDLVHQFPAVLIGDISHSACPRFSNYKVEKAKYFAVIVSIEGHSGGREEAGAGVVGAPIGVIMVQIGDLHMEVIGKDRGLGGLCGRHSPGRHAFDLLLNEFRGLCKDTIAMAGLGGHGEDAGTARAAAAHRPSSPLANRVGTPR